MGIFDRNRKKVDNTINEVPSQFSTGLWVWGGNAFKRYSDAYLWLVLNRIFAGLNNVHYYYTTENADAELLELARFLEVNITNIVWEWWQWGFVAIGIHETKKDGKIVKEPYFPKHEALKFDKNRTTAVIGAESGESYKTVQRYIRLTNLIPELLDLMDKGKIAFSVGVELSYLPPEIQQELFEIIDREDCTPSYSQAYRLHKSFNNCSLTREGLAAVMSEEKPNQKEKVSFKYDDLRKYFPDSYSVGDIQRYILNLVAKDYQRQHNRSRGGDAR